MSAQGWGWPRAAAAGLLSACTIQIGSLWFSSPSLASSYPTIWLRGLSLNFRGLLTALKLKDAGGVKMLLLLVV